MTVISEIYKQQTLPGFDGLISSPVSEDGNLPCSLQDGETPKSGRVAARASRSQWQESEKESKTIGTCGPTGSISSKNVDQPSSSESKSHQQQSSEERRKLRDREYGKKYRKKHRAKDLIRHGRVRAEKKGLPFDLDEHVEAIQKRIDAGICEVTELALNLDNGRTWDSPSIDRIDSSKGYLYENIRIVCHAANSAMGDWGENIVVAMAAGIMTKRREKSNQLSEALGQRLQKNLSGLGSPEYSLTWSRRVTPSGNVFYRLVASGRRTSGSDCSGVRGWPTATVNDSRGGRNRTAVRTNAESKHHDGLTLVDAAVMAGWATPTCVNFRSPKNARPLQEQAGLTSTSSPASMESRGVLNPALSRWLMGYPVEWMKHSPGFANWQAWQAMFESFATASSEPSGIKLDN